MTKVLTSHFQTRDWDVKVCHRTQKITVKTRPGAERSVSKVYDKHGFAVMIGRFLKGDRAYIGQVARKIWTERREKTEDEDRERMKKKREKAAEKDNATDSE